MSEEDDEYVDYIIEVTSTSKGNFKVEEYDGEGLAGSYMGHRQSKRKYFNRGSLTENKEAAVEHAHKRRKQLESDGRDVQRQGIPYWTDDTCIHRKKIPPADRSMEPCEECGVAPVPPGVTVDELTEDIVQELEDILRLQIDISERLKQRHQEIRKEKQETSENLTTTLSQLVEEQGEQETIALLQEIGEEEDIETEPLQTAVENINISSDDLPYIG